MHPALYEFGPFGIFMDTPARDAMRSREFSVRMSNSSKKTKSTFLSLSDIDWFCKKLQDRVNKKYFDTVTKPYKDLLMKHDARIGAYFMHERDDGLNMQFPGHYYFSDIFDYNLAGTIRRELGFTEKNEIRVKKSAKRSLDQDDVKVINFLLEVKEIYQKETNSISKLKGELEQVLTREELFKIFPTAKDLFKKEYLLDSKQQLKAIEDRYDFVDELLKK